MPAHWLPIGISKMIDKDVRWSGMFLLLGMIITFVYVTNKKNGPAFDQIVTALILPFILLIFYLWGAGDLFITYETPVAAFYLLLAFGLTQRNLFIATAGIILCLLSRYTMVFWLPLFGLILLHEKPLKQNIVVWVSVALALLLCYILPFLARAPEILTVGVKYHNIAAIAEWGYETSWSFELGTYFAPHFDQLFSGNDEEKVFKLRIVQGSLMILLNIVGYISYRKWRHRINYYDFNLAALYLFLVFFYAFSPLTYRYYLISTLLLAAVLIIQMLRSETPLPGSPENKLT
jgi:hypothetical protein